jgi:GDPmannose 4,6-dehydratase
MQDKLFLGNLDAFRDWGFAGDYVEAMWLMLQQDTPDDYVIATNEKHSVRQFVDAAFSAMNMDWQEYVEIDPKFWRPAEVNILRGDYTKAYEKLGWSPKVSFFELVQMMVVNDYHTLAHAMA